MKTTLKTPILAGVGALLFTFGAWRTQPLSAVTKPYLGTYECARAYYGEREVLGKFEYIRLELKDEENFIFYFCEKGGKRQEARGKYRYNAEKNTITLSDTGGGFKREFPLKNGAIFISAPIMGKLLQLQFKQP